MRNLRCLALMAGVTLVGSACSEPGGPPEDPDGAHLVSDRAGQALVAHLDKAASALGTSRAEFVRKSLTRDELGFEHARYQQTYRGVKVLGGEALVHHGPDGREQAMTDDFRHGIQVDVTPRLSEVEAVARAVALHGGYGKLTAPPESELVIYRDERSGRDFLTYKVQLRQEDGTDDTSWPVKFIDAHTGELVEAHDNLQKATGTGYSLYQGAQSITTLLSGGTYYLEDTTLKVGTFEGNTSSSTVLHFSDADNLWGNSSTSNKQSAAVDAHLAASKTLTYLSSVHGRNGINGTGGPFKYTSADGTTGLVSSVVLYGGSYSNAYWNGSGVTYGTGDGVTFRPLTTLDICGHEMFHGINIYTANLTTVGEAGSINESWADVFGAMVERYAKGESANTWKMGEDAYIPGGGLRRLDDPHLNPGGGVDSYCERDTSGTSAAVYTNVGIGNKAFYLAAKGGTHHLSNVSVTGIGASAAEKIWYRALRDYMTSSTNYKNARLATMNAASALYGSGSAQVTDVELAWRAVGVDVDTVAPVVSITAPTASTVSGSVPITVSATDNKFVSRVEFLVDGVVVFTDNAAPFSYTWDSTTVSNGAHTLTVRAYDPVCNMTSATKNVTVACNNSVNLLLNADFEAGTANWTAPSYVIGSPGGNLGPTKAELGSNPPNQDLLYQDVFIPVTACSAKLSFMLKMATVETASAPVDNLSVGVRDPSGLGGGAPLFTASHLNAPTYASYKKVEVPVDVGPYKGSTLRVYFESLEDTLNPTSFLIDETALTITQ